MKINKPSNYPAKYSSRYSTSISMIGLWMILIVLPLVFAPKAHTRLTQDLYPQSLVQLKQQLITAIESKQPEQVMHLFNWERYSTEEVEQMKLLWQQTLADEELAEVKLMPLSADFEEPGHDSTVGYHLTMNDNQDYSRVAIQGELKVIFKSRKENGFSSTVSLTLPYGTMLVNEGLYTYSVSLLAHPAGLDR